MGNSETVYQQLFETRDAQIQLLNKKLGMLQAKLDIAKGELKKRKDYHKIKREMGIKDDKLDTLELELEQKRDYDEIKQKLAKTTSELQVAHAILAGRKDYETVEVAGAEKNLLNLHTLSKLRNKLETLEKLGRPETISLSDWSGLSRDEKWAQLFNLYDKTNVYYDFSERARSVVENEHEFVGKMNSLCDNVNCRIYQYTDIGIIDKKPFRDEIVGKLAECVDETVYGLPVYSDYRMKKNDYYNHIGIV